MCRPGFIASEVASEKSKLKMIAKNLNISLTRTAEAHQTAMMVNI